MNNSGQPESQNKLRRMFLFIPLKRLLPYVGLIIGILMIIFQHSLWTYTESIVGKILIDIIRIETRGQYTITYDKVRFNVLKDQLKLTKFSVVEKIDGTNVSQNDNHQFALKSSLLSLNVSSFLDVLIRRQINIQGLELSQPSLRIVDRSINQNMDTIEAKSGKVFNLVSKYLDNFKIKELKINNAAIEYFKILPDTTYTINLSDISVRIASLEVQNPLIRDEQKFSSSQFEFEILNDSIEFVPGHLISFSKIRGSSQDSLLRVEDLRIIPRNTEKDGMNMNVTLPFFQLSGFHPRQILFNDTIRASELRIGNGELLFDLSHINNSAKEIKMDYKLPTLVVGATRTQKLDVRITYPFEGSSHFIDIKKLEITLSKLLLNKSSIENWDKLIRGVNLNLKAADYSVDFGLPRHRLTSKNIILNTRLGYFSTDNLQILPSTSQGPRYVTNIRNIQMWSLNIADAVLSRKLESRKILIRRMGLDISSNSQLTKNNEEFDFANVHPLVANVFSSIKIRDLQIRDSNLILRNSKTKDETKLDNFTIRLANILIDSSLILNPNQILGAANIEVMGSRIDLKMKSGTKAFNSGSYIMSTKSKKIQFNDVQYSSNFPSFQRFGSNSINATGIKWFELIHNQNLIMDSLSVRQLGISIDKLDSIYIPTDSLIFTSTLDFVDSLNVKHITLGNGELDIKGLRDVRIKVGRIKGIMENVNVVKKNDKLYWHSYQFYAENGPFTISLNRMNHRISGKSMIISKSDSTLRMNQLSISPLKATLSGNESIIKIPNLLLTGVDLTHLLDSNLITTKKTVFINPEINIRYNKSTDSKKQDIIIKELASKSQLRYLAEEISILNGTVQAQYDLGESKWHFVKADWLDLTLNKFQYIPEIEINSDLHFIDNLQFAASGLSHSAIAMMDTIRMDGIQFNSSSFVSGQNITTNGSNDQISIDAIVPGFNLSSRNWLKKFIKSDYSLDSLLITKPVLKVQIKKDSTFVKEASENPAFSLLDFQIDSGKMDITYRDNIYSVPEFDLDIDHLDLTGEYKHLYSKNFSIKMKRLKNLFPKSNSIVDIKEASISTGNKSLQIDGLEINPKYSKLTYGKEIGYQTDWIYVNAEKLNLTGLDFPGFLESGSVYISDGNIDNVDVKIYRDKNIPFPENQVRYMPHQMIANIDFPFTVESFVTNNASIIYEELAEEADSAGYVEFSNLTMGISNITNDSTRLIKDSNLRIASNSDFMQSGNLQADFEFDLLDPNGSHTYKAYLSKMPLTKLNVILEPNVSVHVKSGTLTGMSMQVEGNLDYSLGNMRFLYNDLHFNFMGKKKGSTSSMGPAMGSFFANTFIVNRNNPKLVLVRNGDIYFERDTTKSIINFITKSTLSGVVSSIGARNNRKYIKKLNDEARENQERKKKRERMVKVEAITSKRN